MTFKALHFATPEQCGEQDVGDGPQQIVDTGRGKGGAEHHNHSSSVDGLLPGLRLQDAVVWVEVLADHEEDHSHRDDSEQRHVSTGQKGCTRQDGRRVDTRQAAVHEWHSTGEETEAYEH